MKGSEGGDLKIFTEKSLKSSFAIVCPDNSPSLLGNTANCIACRFPEVPFICVANGSATAAEMSEMKAICPAYKGSDTISSLVNVALRHAPAEWVFVVFAGSTIPPKIDEKFGFFVGGEKDILYPVVHRMTNFIDGSWNGLYLNKKNFRDVGQFMESGELHDVKCEWASRALEAGCRFKGIVGIKVC